MKQSRDRFQLGVGLGLAICLALTPGRAAVTINEFLPNNGGGLQDEDLQSPG